jgi:putative hydrolase of the HAD superfamily
VDVGGTLLPNGLPMTPAMWADRAQALAEVLRSTGQAAASVIDAVGGQMAAPPAEAAEDGGNAEVVIARVLAERGFERDPVSVRRALRALCAPLAGNLSPFDGAAELLSGIRNLGLRCLVVSNTTFRDAEMYKRDFEAFGWDGWVDGYVTSVDAGCSKPDERIFRLALEMSGSPPQLCVMIGNSEQADVEPALRLGMRAIRVAIEEPAPAVTAADAWASELHQALCVLEDWLAPAGR